MTKKPAAVITALARLTIRKPKSLAKGPNFRNIAANLVMDVATRLNTAASAPGLSAHDVALLEARRNRVAAHAAKLRGSAK